MIKKRKCPIAVKKTQREALAAELYLVRQVGPTAWMVGTVGGDPYRVSIGQLHSCTCHPFRSSKELCIHLIWILIRKLGFETTNPISYQLGMTERELDDCLCPPRRETRITKKKQRVEAGKAVPVKRKPIDADDICPICLEKFSSKRLPVVYCKYSCGQMMHGKCMEVVAKHQQEPDLTCPLCRGHFSSSIELRQSMRASILPPLPCTKEKIKTGPAVLAEDGRFQGRGRKLGGGKVQTAISQDLKRPKYLPKLVSTKSGPSALLDESPSMKCPVCTDQGFSVVALECGHFIPTRERETVEPQEQNSKPHYRGQCRTLSGRLSRPGPVQRQFVPLPEVVVHRLELAKRSAPPMAAPKRKPRPKKKKELTPDPLPPDPIEKGRLLGSKVLPLMALLLQRQEEEEEEEDANGLDLRTEGEKIPEDAHKEEKSGKRKLTIQCVQLLPDAEAMPVKPGSSRRNCHS